MKSKTISKQTHFFASANSFLSPFSTPHLLSPFFLLPKPHFPFFFFFFLYPFFPFSSSSPALLPPSSVGDPRQSARCVNVLLGASPPLRPRRGRRLQDPRRRQRCLFPFSTEGVSNRRYRFEPVDADRIARRLDSKKRRTRSRVFTDALEDRK